MLLLLYLLLLTPSETASNLLHSIKSMDHNWGSGCSSTFKHCSSKAPKHMKIAMEKHFPFFRPGNSTHPSTGSDINLLDSIASALKFTYEITSPPDGDWGSKNGTEWNGMIGMLIRNEADASLSGMTLNYERQVVVPFSTPYGFERLVFVTKKPALKSKTWAIFWPYTYEVWLSLAATIFFIALWLTWLQTRLVVNQHRKLQFRNALMYIFQSLLNQGYYNAQEPRCRVLMSFWWIFCITLIAGYNGSLMSIMARPGFSPAIDTISKLISAVKKREISVGTIENSADYALFKDSDEKDLQLIFQNMESNSKNYVHHDVEGLRETLRRKYAYVGGWLTVQADVWDARLFLFSSDAFLQNGYAIAFAPGFDHLEAFNRKILQLLEAGLIDKWIMDMIEESQKRGVIEDIEDGDGNSDDSDSHRSSLGIDDVQGAFAVLSIGLLLAAVSFIAEFYIFKTRLKKKSKFHQWRYIFKTENKDIR